VNRRLLFALVGGILLLVGLGVGYRLTAPRLVEVDPSDGASQVPIAVPLSLTFSRPMRASSVETRFTTDPPRSGRFDWQGTTLVFTPDQPWPSGDEVWVTLEAGAQSTWWVPLLRTERWSFRTNRALLAYLWPADAPADLYVLDPVSGYNQRLTTEPGGVLDFDIPPDGLSVYYSALQSDGGSALLQLDRSSGETSVILSCPEALCTIPRITSDGGALAYERTPRSGTGEDVLTQVWWLTLPAGTPERAGPPDHQTRDPVRSPSGVLAFYDHDQKVYYFLEPSSGESLTIPNETGEPGTWSPEGDRFAFSEVVFWGNAATEFASHLIVLDYGTGSIIQLSSGNYLEDATPMFSPDGNQIAFGRRYLDSDQWTLGRQLWVMDAGGRDASQLTAEPNFFHTAFAWSLDGGQLAFVRYNQTSLTDPPEIWLISAEGTNPVRLMIGGYSPQWIP
jgi:Tol biopolymer transport system component